MCAPSDSRRSSSRSPCCCGRWSAETSRIPGMRCSQTAHTAQGTSHPSVCTLPHSCRWERPRAGPRAALAGRGRWTSLRICTPTTEGKGREESGGCVWIVCSFSHLHTHGHHIMSNHYIATLFPPTVTSCPSQCAQTLTASQQHPGSQAPCSRSQGHGPTSLYAGLINSVSVSSASDTDNTHTHTYHIYVHIVRSEGSCKAGNCAVAISG